MVRSSVVVVVVGCALAAAAVLPASRGDAAPTAASASTKPSPELSLALDHLKKARAKLEAAKSEPERDRALIATDSAIEATERAMGMAKPATGKGLDSATIASTIAGKKANLSKICFGPYAAGGSAKVTLDLRIASNGVVSDAVLSEQSGGDPRVGRCVVGQAWWWRFPASLADSTAVVPFAFSK